MNRGFMESSIVAAGSPNWWSINNMRPPPPQPLSPFLASPNSNPFPHYFTPPLIPQTSSLIPISSSWHDHHQELPESWSQLLLGGLVGEEDKTCLSHMHAKKMENWEDQNDVKPSNNYIHGHENIEYQAQKPTWSQVMPMASSPNSCVSSISNSMLEFSSNKADKRHPEPDLPLECNSTGTGGALKKARVQPSSTLSTFKVRKEKLGDRITALHQIVSPFGKTDTASVLLESIGYIRFLQSQIEALSLPYLGSGSGNMRQQHSVQGERNCLFPEDPGQLLNDNCMKRKGASQQDCVGDPKKDLRSRGLCLVPISCTLHVGSDNGADYWASALGGGGGFQ